jgi:hypothetical protein
MREQRWPWLLTAGLMLVAAAATGRSTYLYWLPCRGSMLRGSIINYYVDVGRKFSPACKQAMDGDIALVVPWTSGLNLVAMALLGWPGSRSLSGCGGDGGPGPLRHFRG